MPAPAQSPELDTAAQLRNVIGRLARQLRPTTAGTAAGLTPTRVTVLLDVVRRGPLRLAEIAGSEGINPTMLSRVVADLTDTGLLQRTSDSRDRRAAWVTATATGRRLAQRMRRERTEAVDAALGALSAEDRQALQMALAPLERLVEALAQVPR